MSKGQGGQGFATGDREYPVSHLLFWASVNFELGAPMLTWLFDIHNIKDFLLNISSGNLKVSFFPCVLYYAGAQGLLHLKHVPYWAGVPASLRLPQGVSSTDEHAEPSLPTVNGLIDTGLWVMHMWRKLSERSMMGREST